MGRWTAKTAEDQAVQNYLEDARRALRQALAVVEQYGKGAPLDPKRRDRILHRRSRLRASQEAPSREQILRSRRVLGQLRGAYNAIDAVESLASPWRGSEDPDLIPEDLRRAPEPKAKKPKAPAPAPVRPPNEDEDDDGAQE